MNKIQHNSRFMYDYDLFLMGIRLTSRQNRFFELTSSGGVLLYYILFLHKFESFHNKNVQKYLKTICENPIW